MLTRKAMPKFRRWTVLGALGLLSTTPLAGHAAEGAPVRVRALGSITHDSNVFRAPEGVPTAPFIGRSDTVTSAGVALILDYTFGRQRLVGDARVLLNDFSRHSFLDHTETGGRATLEWRAGNELSGDVGYERSRSLAAFGDFRVPIRSMVTREREFVLGRYQLGARMTPRLQLSRLTVSHDTLLQRPADREEVAYEGGWEFSRIEGNLVGVLLRRTEGTFPHRAAVALPGGDFRQNDVEWHMSWRPTGASRLTGFIGYTQRRHDTLRARDFDGPSGRITLDWAATGKTRVSLTGQRELVAYEDVDASYALTSAIGLLVNWAATAKINVRLDAQHRDREFLGDPGLVLAGLSPREDTTRALGLTAVYRPLANVELTTSLARERRTANRPFFDYSTNIAFIGAQLTY
jgi:exopolysaccharide biosynthesis operon protein EpsL